MKDELKESYLELASEITEKLDNTATYENWLIIQDYIDIWLNQIENLENEVDSLKDQLQWWKQQCDDLEMQIGEQDER